MPDQQTSYPGFVVLPDGTNKFVQDKWAYYKQNPGTFERTTEHTERFHASLKHYKDEVDKKARIEAAEKQAAHDEAEAKGEIFTHWCVSGMVPHGCDECRASIAK